MRTIAARQPLCQKLNLVIGRREGHSGLQATEQIVPGRWESRRISAEGGRKPNVPGPEHKTRRHHTDNRARHSIQRQHRSDHVRISSKPALPKAVAQQANRGCLRAQVGWCRNPPQ